MLETLEPSITPLKEFSNNQLIGKNCERVHITDIEEESLPVQKQGAQARQSILEFLLQNKVQNEYRNQSFK